GTFRPGAPWSLSTSELEQMPGFSRDIEKSRAEAKRLLQEAGHANLKLRLVNRNIDQPFIPAGIFVVDQWKRIGVEAQHAPLETKLWIATRKSGACAPGVHTIPDSADAPPPQLILLLSKYMWGVPYSRHTDTKIDDMFTRQSQIVDSVERIKLVNEMERYVL